MTRYLFILTFVLCSCAGYQIGGSKPAHLSAIKSIYVPLFQNDTLLERAETIATNSAVDAITRDGTYKVLNNQQADGVLLGKITRADFNQVSTSRLDSDRAEELNITLSVEWALVDANNPQTILEKGTAKGSTRFFAADNISIARTNGLEEALRKACESIVTRLSDGF